MTFLRAIAVSVALMALNWPALADESPTAKEAWTQAVKAAIVGPYKVSLADQANLEITSQMAFIPLPQAATLMKSWGNSVDEMFKGLVISTADDQTWVVSIDQVKEGFVKDEDARNWNVDELLQSLKDGTAEQNKVRKQMGIPELEVIGWIQKPVYDAATHRLAWSIKAIDPAAPADQTATVNYSTYALGRDGYFELDLMSDTQGIEKDKTYAQKLLANFTYLPGKRYEDFNGSTDRIAEYGLAALVAGVAAKKLGFLALAAAFLAKFAKAILIGAVVFGGAVMKFFRRFTRPSA